MTKALQTMEWMTPGSNLNAYIQGAAAIPILSVDEEKSLGESLFYNEDLDAARKLVLAHLRFVVHIARSYNGYGLPLGDLIQEGNVGLMKAVRRFNPEKGVRLVSFAVHWIKAEIHEFILKNWRIVKVATTKAQRKLFFNLRSAKKELEWLSQDEAKARGCASCTLIEKNKKVFICLRNTIESFGSSVDLINDDALKYLASTQFTKKFDIVFIDPPFDSNLHESVIQVLEEKHLLNVDAKIYVENDANASELLVPKNWSLIRNQVAGQVKVMLYSRSANSESDK